MNNIKTKYIFVSQQEFPFATTDSIENKIEHIEADFSQSCETKILTKHDKNIILSRYQFELIPNESIFFSINLPNSFYVTVQSPITFVEICQNTKPETVTLNNSGILELEPGCHIITMVIAIIPFSTQELITMY